jgi:hypothetical protein
VAAKTLLSRFVTRIVVKDGVLNDELATRSSGDEFVITNGWWAERDGRAKRNPPAGRLACG